MPISSASLHRLNTVRTLAPIVTHTLKSGQLFSPHCELTEADPDILCEYDVEIPMAANWFKLFPEYIFFAILIAWSIIPVFLFNSSDQTIQSTELAN